MTMTSRYQVQCPCGYNDGYIRMRENDQPFSRQYESYSLVGLNGGSQYLVQDTFANMQQVLDELKPTCPDCDSLIQSEWVKG